MSSPKARMSAACANADAADANSVNADRMDAILPAANRADATCANAACAKTACAGTDRANMNPNAALADANASATSWPPLFRLAPDLQLALASASPRRQQFLAEWGLPYTLARPENPEPRPQLHEDPTAYALRAAEAKGLDVYARSTDIARAGTLILAADTVVAVGSDILGKPTSEADALRMLQRLSGQGHTVISAVCLILPQHFGPRGEQLRTCAPQHLHAAALTRPDRLVFSESSRVFFHHFSDDVLRAYAATHEPDDKAGAYAVQGQGAFLVERVEGSWSTVVGLPVTALARVLLMAGLIHAAHSA